MASSHKARIIATVTGHSRGDFSARGALEIKPIKSSPPYTGQVPRYKVVKEKSITVDGVAVAMLLKAFPPENYLVEAVAEVPDVFAPSILQFKDKLIAQAEVMIQQQTLEKNFREEFTLYCVSGYKGQPEQFFEHGQQIASLLKSEGVSLSAKEIEKTMASSIQYGKNDLTIVDWDGAFIFDPDADWQDTVDFLEVANMHLLRLRFLDEQLDQRLEKMAAIFSRLPKVGSKALRETIRELMKLRAQSIIEFEHSDRDIQLIGDWYAARLYDVVGRKLHLHAWRQAIREKLKSLEDMSSMVADHFSVTVERRAEQVQQILWYIQLIGWFLLLYFEFRGSF